MHQHFVMTKIWKIYVLTTSYQIVANLKNGVLTISYQLIKILKILKMVYLWDVSTRQNDKNLKIELFQIWQNNKNLGIISSKRLSLKCSPFDELMHLGQTLISDICHFDKLVLVD